MVLFAAKAYDAQHATKSNSYGTRCSYTNVMHKYTPTEYDLDDSYNIDSFILQLNINNINNDYNPELNIHNVNTEYNPENGQTDQLATFNSVLTQRPRLNRSQWAQLSIEARSTLNLVDDADKTIILSDPHFLILLIIDKNINHVVTYQIIIDHHLVADNAHGRV